MNMRGRAAGAPPPIGAAELERRLLDPDIPDDEIRPYLVEDAAAAGAFRPEVRADPNAVIAAETEAAVALASLNGIDRWRRLRRYRRRILDPAVPRLVSEGDSWFQYPFLLTDVIDWLGTPYAILSLDAAGDLLSDMVRQGEILTAVVQERPRAVLLSGGGNDLLGGANLTRALRRFEPGLRPRDYLGQAFEHNLGAVIGGFRTLFARLAQVAPHTPVMTHVYDYALPAGGRWLGQPMRALGIADPALQAAIVREIVDRFEADLRGLAAGFPRVRVIDTRGTVPRGEWHDELHPTDAGFRKVAMLFATAIGEAIGTPPPRLAPAAGAVEAVAPEPSGGPYPAAEAARFPDAVILREIGRRALLKEAGDPLADSGPVVFPSSIAGVYPELEARGRAAIAAAPESIPDGTTGGLQAALIALAQERGLAATRDKPRRRKVTDTTLAEPSAPARLSAGNLLRRMEGPASPRPPGGGSLGTESVALPPSGVPDAQDRIEAAKSMLRRLAETTAEVDESDVDRMILDAEEALRKLDSEGDGATLTSSEAFATEAVIETDGSRPVLHVQDGTIDLAAPELNESRAQRWKEPATRLLPGITKVASSVGAVQLPAFPGEDGHPKRIGTAFAIGAGFVLTNRHVLEVFAKRQGDGWEFTFDVEVDFAGERGRDTRRVFTVKRVLLTGADAIDRTINFAHADFAILELTPCAEAFPAPLTLGADPAQTLVGATQPQIYVMGFPAQPLEQEGVPGDAAPGAGHEYREILEKLFRNRFGSKRWAPGFIEAGPGQLRGDARKWVMSHDASTLGGNSGSCVVDFQDDGALILGLHFGGSARVENWAHVLAALRGEIGEVAGIAWSPAQPPGV